MSGREPVEAFFPSIDRNLMAELDRHFRASHPAEPEASAVTRPDIEHVVEAVEQAGSSIAAMTTLIEELQARVAALEATNRELDLQLAESSKRHDAAEAHARAHSEHAEECQRIAAQHFSRADALEQDLATALADLNRVTDAIARTLG